MDRFKAAEYALEALKKAGADEAQVTASEGYTEELNAEVGEFSLYRTLFDSALNLKAVKGGKKGVGIINIFDKDAIDEAVASCIAAAEAGVVDEAEGIAELMENKSFTDGTLEADKDGLYVQAKEYLEEVKEKYPKINVEQFITRYTQVNVLLMNSNGVKHDHKSGNYGAMVMFTGQDGEKSTSFNYHGNRFTDVSRKLLDMGLNRQNLEETVRSFDPIIVDGKFTGPIIFSPNCVAEFMQYIGDLFLGDRVMIEGTSIWKDKLGQTVTHPSLTMSLNPSDPRIVCGERFTADGYISEDMDVIKDGVLKTFLLSRYGSKKTGKDRAKNLSQALIVKPGDVAFDDMLKGIDKGIYVNRFSGGSPAGNGDFSGVAKNSFLIKDGKIGEPVNETMISGNIEELFKNVLGISKETVEDGSSVLPWIAVGGVTISGK